MKVLKSKFCMFSILAYALTSFGSEGGLFLSDPSIGYEVRNLGINRNEIAIVFTNHTEVANWVVPCTLRDVSFLVVAGGGGGGADRNKDANEGGAGGGGGGVVTGVVSRLNKGDVLSAIVGAGGLGGVSNDLYEKGAWSGTTGGNSAFRVEGVDYVTAYGGGGDGGYMMAGKAGGSSAGSRSDKTNDTTLSEPVKSASINTHYVGVYESFGSAGGAGLYVSFLASAGGGGACSPGEAAVSHSQGGNGGEGLASDVTGVLCVYGSGGGGGASLAQIQGKGGTGAGDGNKARNNESKGIDGDGFSAPANFGGGGGGGGGEGANGGNGGSGVVVIRFSNPANGINIRIVR